MDFLICNRDHRRSILIPLSLSFMNGVGKVFVQCSVMLTAEIQLSNSLFLKNNITHQCRSVHTRTREKRKIPKQPLLKDVKCEP